MNETANLGPLPLPVGIRQRYVDNINGLRMHVLEAGYETAGRPLLLLLHGFPELAYSWRKVMLPLAALGYHVVAPDQRGYGRTTGWDPAYDGDVGAFHMMNIARDAIALVNALGYRSVAAVFGHDFGSPAAACCALIRPDVFPAVAMMSAPFAGPPAFPFDTERSPQPAARPDIHAGMAALPRPRKHYQWYYSEREADAHMRFAPQGLHAFLRAYYHVKSADWDGNRIYRLGGWSAEEFAKLPTYYIMDLAADMAQTVAPYMPTAAQIAACRWLPDAELAVYAAEYGRVGFQGGLQWYRCATGEPFIAQLRLFSGRTIDVPSCFIAGSSDWGVYQKPGDFEAMQERACTRMLSCDLVDGAGHWVQQEQPERVAELLARFLGRL